MLLPVRGSATPGKSGTSSRGEKPFNAAPIRCPSDFARFIAISRARRRAETAIGGSEVVSDPPPMPASICPVAILLAMVMMVSSEVPQARWWVMPGVSGDRPEDSVTSRPMFQSRECLSTAPSATSPSCTPDRPKRSTSAATALIDSGTLPRSEYTVLLRQKGMRAPPMMAAGLRVVWRMVCDPARRSRDYTTGGLELALSPAAWRCPGSTSPPTRTSTRPRDRRRCAGSRSRRAAAWSPPGIARRGRSRHRS